MSEPGDELTPLPDEPEKTPTLSRSPYVALGVAALVVSTVFATVAALASTREEQAAPAPQSEDTVETSTPETYTTDPTTTSAPASSKPKKPPKHKKDGSATASMDTVEDGTTTTNGGGATTRPRPTSPKPPTTKPPAPKPPTARIGGGCPETGQDCSFDGGGSTDPDGSIAKYEWNFGDGQTGTGANVDHHYEPGTYTVKLTVTDSQGLKSTTSIEVTVNAASTTSGN